MQDRLFENEKVDFIWDHTVEEVIGDETGMTSLRLKHAQNGEETIIDKHGLFVAIGHDPATELFHDKLKMDDQKYIITAPDSTATSVPGVYAAGDVTDHTYRQAVTAAGMGCMAALEADRFLAGHK